MNGKLKIALIISAAVAAVGLVMLIIILIASGGRAGALSSFVLKESTYTESEGAPIKELSIDFDNADVEISFGSYLTVTYPEKYTKSGKIASEVTVSEKDGVLRISEHSVWFRNIGIDNTSPKIYITLPLSRGCDLSVELDNGYVHSRGEEGAKLGRLDISIDNGEAEFRHLTASDVEISVENGEVEIYNANVSGGISVEIDNGSVLTEGTAKYIDISVDNGEISLEDKVSVGEKIQLSVDNGSIEAALSGTKSDYTVRVDKSIASSNIESSSGGDKILELECDVGEIEIEFLN